MIVCVHFQTLCSFIYGIDIYDRQYTQFCINRSLMYLFFNLLYYLSFYFIKRDFSHWCFNLFSLNCLSLFFYTNVSTFWLIGYVMAKTTFSIIFIHLISNENSEIIDFKFAWIIDKWIVCSLQLVPLFKRVSVRGLHIVIIINCKFQYVFVGYIEWRPSNTNN